MQSAGIDTTVFDPHSIRSASSTKAVQMGHKIDNVKKNAHWSLAADTFERFYYKPAHQIHNSRDIINSIFSDSENNTTSGVEMEATKVGLGTTYKEHCNLSLKKARLQPIDRNSEEKIQERLDWVRKWEKTDMDFMKNCVFLDESAFHINLKRSMAWSKKGTPAVVTVPKTRATTTTILGAISTEGLIKCCLRLPQPPSSKKRKRGDGVEYMSKGTVTGHYISFLKATMDEMDRYPHMKGHYLVMDNAPIHTSEDIAKYVESRGYHCIYLPSYSPELNPIEQFWSVVKSKVKRHRFLEKETLMTRISEASNSLKLSDFQGIVRHSHKCLDKCRNSQPL
ncbi:hypothetical protein RO3G_03724 [Rhizopus delemar RA 99-880]|uniref:Tc1-like transposase DDE domain-containing protein n=3 Tax=Rhizopus TaxID=4842 RepID=I1BS39_RHIO9|nr:hypothetical protein RO3G_03724 [Rhizopus delemar RA 99-880]|eukprot:EIE79019.1 hypothetical protein RO3G_03724 [Rhizopus delemar RA 99-880]